METTVIHGNMDSSEYARRGGADCPVCCSQNVESTKAMQEDGPDAWMDAECLDCKATWTDRYTLTGYADLETA